jgi:hypothetical protein
MSEWPHEAICTVAIWYIRKHCAREEQWLYTRLLHLHDEMKCVVALEPSECVIVSCYTGRHHWFAMTSARMILCNNNQRFVANPRDVKRWRWGDFKTDAEPRIGTARIDLRDGTSFSFQYETGYASMAPIYYERFWSVKYPALHNLDVARIRGKVESMSNR